MKKTHLYLSLLLVLIASGATTPPSVLLSGNPVTHQPIETTYSAPIFNLGQAVLAPPAILDGMLAYGNRAGLTAAILRVENLSGEKEIILTLDGVILPRQQSVHHQYKVSKNLNITIYTGSWQYKVEIPNKRYISGAFRQTNKDKTTMKVYLMKVAVHGP